jgi:pimeloyl-ACP methyl ester carboxylesterase
MKLKKTSNGIFDVAKPYSTSSRISKLFDTVGNTKIPTLSDAEGLKKAYELPNKVYVDNNTNKMYVAGTSNLRDAWDDLKIPFHLTSYSQRYGQAAQALEENPDVKTVVGHSLGGAVTLELAKNNPGKFRTVTYGSPTFYFGKEKGERYRHPGDPVSMFDDGAVNVPLESFNPFDVLGNHTYTRYGQQGIEDIGNYGNSFSYSHRKI